MDMQKCCGTAMKKSLELGRFTELKCGKCSDVVYVKKTVSTERPMLIDD
jgi:hypothetical protein